MRQFLGNYNPFYTETVKEQIKGLDARSRGRVEERIKDLIADPWHNTEFLKAQYRGKRKLRLNYTDRLVFVICEECRELRHFVYNKCRDCDETAENTIVIAFIIFGHEY
jgi:Txe/YoeB family toxin of Txe-Axe toxin-antitoxin module